MALTTRSSTTAALPLVQDSVRRPYTRPLQKCCPQCHRKPLLHKCPASFLFISWAHLSVCLSLPPSLSLSRTRASFVLTCEACVMLWLFLHMSRRGPLHLRLLSEQLLERQLQQSLHRGWRLASVRQSLGRVGQDIERQQDDGC